MICYQFEIKRNNTFIQLLNINKENVTNKEKDPFFKKESSQYDSQQLSLQFRQSPGSMNWPICSSYQITNAFKMTSTSSSVNSSCECSSMSFVVKTVFKSLFMVIAALHFPCLHTN